MELGAWIYPGAFFLPLALALGLTPVARLVAHRFRIFDQPGGHKSHESPVPYLGGVAIVLSFAVAVVTASAIAAPVEGAEAVALVVGLGVGLSLIGLLDDLRHLNPAIRFGFQIGAALALWSAGIGVRAFDHRVFDAALTVFWIVGITNAFNLLDNMDGLSAGLAAIASFFFSLLAAVNGQLAVGALAAALCGCALGFLRHNFHPARIYMGDAGSLFLGFMLAVIGIKLEFPAPTRVTFLVPVGILGVAILDTTLVVVSRLLHGINPLAGGRDHISHRLVFVGIPVRGAVTLVYGAAVALGWLAIVMSRSDPITALILMGFIVAMAAFAGVLLGLVPIYEQSRRRRMMIMEVVPHEHEPEKPVAKEIQVARESLSG